jgi:polyisoprenoid-binding protein YceI
MNQLLQRSRAVPRAGTYALHPDHCAVELSVRHLVARTVRGRVSPLGGELVVDADDPSVASAWIDLDAASLTTGHADRDAILRGPDLLDVARFPFIRFESRELQPVGPARWSVLGDLYLRDLVSAVQLDVRVLPTRPDRVACVASTSISRSTFELRWDERVERLGVVVGDTVRLQMGVEFGAVDGGWDR